MPSNKKIRGRERKAKAKEKQSGIDEDFALLLRRFQPGRSLECMHGVHPSETNINIYSIIETVAAIICICERRNCRVGVAFGEARQTTEDQYPCAYKDAVSLGLLSQAFLCIGTELLLDRRAGTSTRFQIEIKATNCYRCATLLSLAEYLSQYVEVNFHHSKPFFHDHKIYELISSDERRMVSYLRKRIRCSCLDLKFLQVKSDKKMSVCNSGTCTQRMVELKALLRCERCRKAHYCSQKCQAADFEGHKKVCVGWKKWKKLQKKQQKKRAVKPQDEIIVEN